MTNLYRFFLSVITLLTLANLLIMNDVMTVWSGTEAYNLAWVNHWNSPAALPQWGIWFFSKISELPLFMMRLPGAIIAILGAIGVYFLGRKIFGAATTVATLMIAASSLLLVNVAKFATGDIWIATLHTLAILSQIRFLKQPTSQWRIIHLTLLALATWTNPILTGITFLPFSLFLYFFHPQGKRLTKLYQWIVYPLVFGLMIKFEHQAIFANHSYFSTFGRPSLNHHFYWIIFVGMLPWIGFVLAGIWQLRGRFRKREEFSILISAWLVAALLGKSFSILWLFALLAAKQLENYQLKNFPRSNENIIKTFSILNLIFAFCGAIYLMLNSFYIFEAAGFRSAMLTGAVYWMPLLFGVIGLYGKNDKMIRGGFATAGVLVTLMFWLQTYPFLESQRSLPQRVVETAIAKESRMVDKLIISGKINASSNLWYYAWKSGMEIRPVEIDEIGKLYQERGAGILILNETDYEQLATVEEELNAEAVKGWTEKGEVETYWIVK